MRRLPIFLLGALLLSLLVAYPLNAQEKSDGSTTSSRTFRPVVRGTQYGMSSNQCSLARPSLAWFLRRRTSRPTVPCAPVRTLYMSLDLFQGRLGFQRAIALVEEGCQDVSNIVALITA